MQRAATVAPQTTIHLAIDGMTCGNCVHHVTQALQGVAGVRKADVDLAAGRAVVGARGAVDVAALVAAVQGAGYEAAPA